MSSIKHLLLKVSGVLLSNFVWHSMVTNGKWSDISFSKMADSKLLSSSSLTYMLSIRVTECEVIRLGLVMVGSRFSSLVLFMNCQVGCVCPLNRSKLWPIPISSSGCCLPLLLLANDTILSMLFTNGVLSVFGGLYMHPMINFLPFFADISTNTLSTFPSSNMSRSCLLLNGMFLFSSMHTPPPFLFGL